MSPKPSLESTRAVEIAREVRDALGKTQNILLVYHGGNLINLRMYVWRRLNAEEQKRVVISVEQEGVPVMFVSVKKQDKNVRQESKFKSLLRRAMVHIDDENLYDEVMEALYGEQA